MRRRQVSKTSTTSLARRFTNSGPVLPFNPSSIPGCQLWLDAADSSSVLADSSSNVSLWIDKSGNGYHMDTLTPTATWTGSAAYPMIGTSINGLQTVKFVAQSGLKQGTTLDGVKNFFWVGRIAAPIGSGDVSFFLLGHDTHFDWHSNQYGGRFVHPSVTQTGIYNASPTSLFTSDVNAITNASFSSVNMPSAPNVSLLSVAGITGTTRYQGICYDRTANLGWCGDLAEVVIFNSALTTIQRQKVEGYLAHKWGLQSTLPSNHPFKTAAPTYEQPVFVPTLISGSQLWLDALDTSSMTFSGSTVTGWTDKSGKGFNAATPSGTNPPVYNSTTKELQFVDTNSTVLRIAQGFGDALVGTTYSIFFIARRTIASGYRFILASTANSASKIMLMVGFLDNTMHTNVYGPGYNSSIPTYTSPDPIRLYCYELQSSSLVTHIMNGVQVGSDTQDYRITSFANPELGRRYGQTLETFNLSEMVVFSPALNPTQRKRVEGHLIQKWGLQSSLSTSHPYKTIAPTGIPRSITIQSLSALFNTANNSHLSIPANSALTLGTNNHTIEFWFYQTSRDQYNTPFMYGNQSLFATNNYFMNVGTYIGIVVGNGGGWAINIDGGAVASLNEWHHYAIVRNGTTFTFYLNGTSRGSATSSTNITAQGNVFRIGNSSNTIGGYISNFRLVNGTAVYTSNFTPPTSPLTAIPNTQILLQGLVDRSPNAFTVTNSGGVTLSTSVSPFV
jgi:hypothetical protein